jgi:hypothetical protein
VGTADAGFEHASTPNGDGVFLAKIVDALGFVESADAAEFNVDDFAGSESDGSFGLFVRVDALVEADGRLQGFLDFDVAEEIVPAEGLLNHHEVVGVELLEERKILRAVSRVGVDGKLDPREVLADALNGKQIFARLDF